MYKYNPLYKPNQVICGNGQIAIVTGWTIKESVAKHLDPADFAVIGQLYSPVRGINFLVRNLLLNPHVRGLLVLNATREDNAGGCQCLVDLFNRGVKKGVSQTGKPCWVINSNFEGYLDVEIELEAIDQLRAYVACQEVKIIADVVSLAKAALPLPPWGEPRQFPLIETLPTVLPGELYGHRVEGRTIAETWVKIIHRIKTTGVIRPTGYDGNWQELIDLMTIVTDEPKDFYFPEPNYLPVDREAINNYLPQMLEDAPYQEGVKYTYGQRMRSWFGVDQIEEVIEKLIKEVDAASAVINLWDSGTGNHLRDSLVVDWDCTKEIAELKETLTVAGFVPRYGRSPLSSDHQYGGSPCLNHIWLRVVDGKISMTATLRSNDMFAAWVSNAMVLRALQWHILEEINSRSTLNLAIGPLITISQSAHIYDDCWENADRLIATQYSKLTQRPEYSDPVGNFIIEVSEGLIKVTQTNPATEIMASYEGDRPLKLVRHICNRNPAIQPAHAAYLGIELERAGRLGVDYQQDKECNL